MPCAPYDRWVSDDGDANAEFYRTDSGYLMRFPDQADFAIPTGLQGADCFPVSGMTADALRTLFTNSVRPAVGNHIGELNLHGSGVVIGDKAVAIMGQSRRGKTTLAGAFAKAGHPFLTEDVLALDQQNGAYTVDPQLPVLRVFGDSAAYLLDAAPEEHCADTKSALAANATLPAAEEAAPLAAICVLGPGEASEVTLSTLGRAAALSEIMRHGFLLDVEDKARLHAHFARVAQLAAAVPCLSLDYPREFSKLPDVIRAVQRHLEQI